MEENLFPNPKQYSFRTLVVKECHYHSDERSYTCDKMGPAGLSPEVFHTLYPYALALLYGGKFGAIQKQRQITIRCQVTKDWRIGKIEEMFYRVFTTPKELIGRIVNLTKYILMPFMPSAPEKYRIYMAPVTTESGKITSTLYRMNPGKKSYNIGMKQPEEMCPAAFNSFYPLMLPEVIKEKNGENYNQILVGCPDHHTNIKIRLDFPFAFQKEYKPRKEVGCDEPGNFSIEVVESDGKGSFPFKTGQTFRLKDILRDLGIPCFSAWHALYPYWLCIIKDARVRFFTEEFYSAMVQCPNIEHKVEMKIARVGNSIQVKTTSCRSACPLAMDSQITLPKPGEWPFCPHSLNIVYPYFQVLRHGPSRIKKLNVVSPEINGRTVFCLRDYDSSAKSQNLPRRSQRGRAAS